jgi:hypothetical protein
VEVDEPCEGLPRAHDSLNPCVVERPPAIKPASEVVTRADVVAGEDMQPPKSAQQGVLGSPASDSAQPHKRLERLAVIERLDRGRIERSGPDSRGKLDDAARLCAAEAERRQLFGTEADESCRSWEGVEAAMPVPRCRSMRLSEPVEQADPERKGELLAGDCVDDTLKQRWKPRRLQAPEAPG